MYSSMFLVFVFTAIVQASHFRGAVIQWRPVYNGSVFTGDIEITHRISWVRSSIEGGDCDDTVIASGNLIGTGSGSNLLICDVGCQPAIVVGNMGYFCTDFSIHGNWAAGQQTYLTSAFSALDYFEARFMSTAWAALVIGGGEWVIRVKGHLTPRPDNGRINTSPVAVFSPSVKSLAGCNTTIVIPVSDDDGDILRCRWADSSLDECGGICNSFPGTLNQNKCSLQLIETELTLEGLYAVAIQLEDFINESSTVPLSSVPIQFLVQLADLGMGCESLPVFVADTPANGACFAVQVGEEFTVRITASSNSGYSIEEIVTITPLGFSRTPLLTLTANESYIELSWQPTSQQMGPNIVCYTARNSIGLTSTQSCVTLLVGAAGPEVLPHTISPTGQLSSNSTTNFTLDFSLNFTRPERSSFIRVHTSSDVEILAIDVSSNDSPVYYPGPGLNSLVFTIDIGGLAIGVEHYITMDDGVANIDGVCGTIESQAVTDSTLWRFIRPCTEGAVRLVGGANGFEGRVEVCPNGEWGTVCDDGWDLFEATVVCINLGYGIASNAPLLAFFGEGEGPILLTNLSCSGSEGSLFDCPHGDNVHTPASVCDHRNDAGAVCNERFEPVCADGDLRLEGGTNEYEGRVEVCYSNIWGIVCDDYWDLNDASVACGQLGHGPAVRAPREGAFGEGAGPIALDDLNCTGSEARLIDCPHSGVGTHNCYHSEAAGAVCQVRDPCLEVPCHVNATCERDSIFNDDFNCTCQSPYLGDGLNCTFSDDQQSTLERYGDIIIAVPSSAIAVIAAILLLGVVYGYFTVVSKFMFRKLSADSGKTKLLQN